MASPTLANVDCLILLAISKNRNNYLSLPLLPIPRVIDKTENKFKAMFGGHSVPQNFMGYNLAMLWGPVVREASIFITKVSLQSFFPN